MVPIKFPYSIFGRDFDHREITHQDLYEVFSDHPELIEGNPDIQFIMDELESPNHSGHLSERDLNSDSYRTRGTANNLDIAIRNGERCTDWFTNVVCEHETPEVKPFTVLYNKVTPDNVYFIGFAPNPDMTDTLWESQMSMNTTLPKCNYNPHSAVMESGNEVQDVNGGQVIRFPQETSTDVDILRRHLREAIIRSTQNPNAEKAITSLFCNKDKKYKGIRLYKNVFTKVIIEDIKKDLNTEFGIVIEFVSSGKWNELPDKAYFRYSEISWN